MNARELTAALKGQWHGSYGTACCPAHEDHRPSLSISERAGKLLTRCHAGCPQETVWGALTDKGLVANDQGKTSRCREVSQGSQAATQSNTAFARRIWQESRPVAGTIVETYLRSRGIVISPVAPIRHHPGLLHRPTGLSFPAMVAGVTDPQDQFTAIHRTFLLTDGHGKAQVSDPKMALGPLGNGAARLAPAGKALGLAEGIETALSAMQLFSIPVWAALGSMLDRVAVPPEVVEVQVFADNGQAGQEAAEKAADALTKAGKRVCLRYPPEPLNDWNDALQALRRSHE